MQNTASNAPKTLDVAHQVVDMMAGAGIKNVFAITGDSLNALTNAICDDGRIHFIHMRHEESGAFAASAAAQLTGTLAACAGSSGPGHVHLINGLYDAQRSDAPVLAIASTAPTTTFGTGYFQETNPTLLFSNCSVYNETAANAGQVPHMFQNAMQQAISRGGVGVVGLPADVTGEPASTDAASMRPVMTERLPQVSAEELQAAADMLNNARTVAIFAGFGAKDATAELKEFADLMAAPVVTTYKSQFELTRDCPNFVGHFGYLGLWSATDAVSAADVTLIIGTNWPFPDFFPTDKKLIQVDVRAERIGKRARVDLGVRADSKSFLKALIPLLKRKEDRSALETALANYAKIKERMAEPVKSRGTKGCIRPEYLVDTVDRLADKDAIFTVDTGLNNLWSSHYLHPGESRRMLASFMHGSMANAMPMAIGAAVTCPDRQVIALCGDGGLTMLMGDLLTIIQYQLPVKIIVTDNRELGYVKWEMELAGLKPDETTLTNPDFGAMARAIGFQAETVTDPDDVEGAVQRLLAAKGPALLSVTTDPDAASFTFSEKMMEGAKPGNKLNNFMAPGSC